MLLLLACTPADPFARAFQVTALDQTIGGPKASLQEGDFLLENDRIRIGVVGPRYSLGPSPFGGTVADVDLQRADPAYGGGHGKDAFAELFSTVNMNLIAADEEGEVSIISDGADGKAASIRVDAVGAPFLSLLDALWVIVGQPDMRITTDYILEPGSPALKITTTASFSEPGTELTSVEAIPGATGELNILDAALFTGFSFGDFYLQGGSVDVFASGIGFDEDGAVFEAQSAGSNTFQEPFEVDFVGGVADGVSYALAVPNGSIFIPLFTSSQTAAFGASVPGDPCDEEGETDCYPDRFPATAAYSYTRYLGVGRGDIGSALDSLMEAMGTAHGDVSGHVVEDGTGISMPGLSVLVFQKGAEKPWSQWESDVGDDTQKDGSFGGHLPPGDYELQVHQRGRPPGVKVPVSVVEGQTVSVVLMAPRPGEVKITIVDEQGLPTPAKVTLFKEDGESPLKPDYGDPYIGGSPAEVLFAPYGEASTILPPGSYYAIATRGGEYELGESGSFTVKADGTVDVPLQIIRSVQSPGWVTADFHVHAANSFDSGTQLTDRVVTMVCEGIEFFTSSDHDFITDYAPVVEDLGLEPWVRTGVGLETTTLEIGHFIGFPLSHDTLKPGDKAFDWTGMPPVEILDTISNLGIPEITPVRMVAHPRDGILGYFDQYGYDPYTDTVATPLTAITNPLLGASNFTLEFDALELFNGKRFDFLRTPTNHEFESYGAAISAGQLPPEDADAYAFGTRTAAEQEALISGTMTLAYGQFGQIDDWFTLLNQGHYITALANSDTHGKFSVEAGCPHNYVAVADDTPQSIDAVEIAEAIKAGKVIASYGPFIDFYINAPENTLGSMVADTDGTVSLHIAVEAPLWMAVDRVEVYQNGTLIAELTELDASSPLRVSYELEASVTKDSWFVVIAAGKSSLGPLYSPVEMPPVELQDVVTEALADVPGVGSLLGPAELIPRTGDVFPFAMTNPIRVDMDGGDWTPPGIPDWWVEPPEPSE